MKRTFVLDGLALSLGGALGDGATDEDDKLLDAGTLEIAEVAYIGRIRKYYRIGSIRDTFKHQQSCDLHISLSPPLSKLFKFKASFFSIMRR